MHAQVRAIGDLYLGHGAPHTLSELHPELSRVRLGFCYGGPVIAYMLILAYYLTGMAPVTLFNIYYKYLF